MTPSLSTLRQHNAKQLRKVVKALEHRDKLTYQRTIQLEEQLNACTQMRLLLNKLTQNRVDQLFEGRIVAIPTHYRNFEKWAATQERAMYRKMAAGKKAQQSNTPFES